MQYFLGVSSYYRNHIKTFSHITSSLHKVCSKDVVFEITKERRDAYERIKHELNNAPVFILPDFEPPFKLYIDAACSQGLGAALHQRQIVDGEPREGLICYISRKLKDSEARYGATKTECLYRRKNFRLSEWAPESGTPDSEDTEPEGEKTPILGISFSELHNEFFSLIMRNYAKRKQCSILLQLLQQKNRSPELESQLEEPWLRDYTDDHFFLMDGLLYHREKHISALIEIDRDHIFLILQQCHDCPYMGHMSKDRTKERVKSTAWWPQWE
ncbi:hypothetical protein O181_047024 [Austropuccinia psidii MF-1]|uniref:Reverse transcriptase/retrotransposon-derived protein RNase H-like domain-containing protein n=1 Tax=Austropuccinia psidii MF-1 TaxID=1389203 RepID=A0A9Q3HLQ9_9BASI|nr:hypothetical protein [Austropuccinia psidii MF-1]